MSWYDDEPRKSLTDLKQEALALVAKPPESWGRIRPVAAEGRIQVRTPLGHAFFAASTDLSESQSRISKARGLLRHHCLVDLQIKEGPADAELTRDGGGGDGRVHGSSTYETAFRLPPPPPGWWDLLCDELRPGLSAADAATLASGQLPDPVVEVLEDLDCPLLPQPGEVELSCTCLDGDPACKHVLCTLLGVAVLIDDDPPLLLRLHGLDVSGLTPDLSAALPAEADAPADALDADTAARLFGF